MRVEKNYNLPAPSVEDIISSKPIFKPSPGCAFKGTQLVDGILGLTFGHVCVQTDGLAFLTQGNKFTRMMRAGWGNIFEDGLIDIAAKAVPFGGVAAALLVGGAKKLDKKKLLVDEMLGHPESFVHPYTNIIEVRHEGIGNIIHRKEYLVILTEDENRQTQYYSMVLTGQDKMGFSDGTVPLIIGLRFKYEKQTLMSKIISEFHDLEKARLDTVRKYIAQYGEKAGKHMDEIVAETTRLFLEAMKTHGITQEQINTRLKEQLVHFRHLVNQPGFEKTITPFFTQA
jgi:hypothetical protein